MSVSSVKINENLYLNCAVVSIANQATTQGTNHFVVMDRSGSMYGAMPQMRELFKHKVVSMIGDEDTLTLLAFSSKGDYAVVCKGEKLKTMKDLRNLHRLMDQELRATNLTGFKEPLEEVAELAVELSANGNASSLWFMSDGYENQWPRKEVIEAMRKASTIMGAVTVVEFGDYADRSLLAELASVAGGEHIYTRDFDRYVPEIGKALRRRSAAGKVDVPVPGRPLGDFVYAVTADAVVSSAVVDGIAKIPTSIQEIAWMSTAPAGRVVGDLGKKYLYAALSLYSARMQSEIVYPVLKFLGDVKFVKDYSVCFGKQRYAAFMDLSKEAALGRGRYELGQDFNCVPPDDCFTLWDLLGKLAGSDSFLLLDRFKYRKIGAKTVSAADRLNRDEAREVQRIQDEISELSEKISGSSIKVARELSEKLHAAQTRLSEILSSKVEPPEFVPDDAGTVSLKNLVYNEERPNVSVRVLRKGRVNLTAHKKFELPDWLESQEYRTYTIIKDGLLNVEELPVRVPTSLWAELSGYLSSEVLSEANGYVDVVIDLTKIPILNRAMVKSASLDNLVDVEFRLCRLRAQQKVLGHYLKESGYVPQGKLLDRFGMEAVTYLKTLGVTDSGYSPKRVTDSSDYYTGKFLTCLLFDAGALTKISSGKSPGGRLDDLPSMKDLVGSKTEPRGGKALMSKHAKFLGELKDSGHMTDEYLSSKKAEIAGSIRELLLEKAKLVFAIIVGQTWFSGFVPEEIVLPGKNPTSLYGNRGTRVLDGNEYDFIVGQEERQIRI